MNKCLVSTILCFAAITCKQAPPEVSIPSIAVAVVDASCTEAWVKVSAATPPVTIALVRNGQRVQAVRLTTTDSLIVDSGLLPRRSYAYVAQKLAPDSSVLETTQGVQIMTMDTTSHNFAFHLDTLGVGNGSELYDVAIINDTLVYAVGEMYMNDSTGRLDPIPYNLVKWNGTTWQLKRIPFIGACSAVHYPPIWTIWAIQPNQVLLTNGGAIVTYDGNNAILDCRMNSLLTGAINRIFATSAQDVYAVGNNGNIIHYDGRTWQRVESGTTLTVYDIIGQTNVANNVSQICAVAAQHFESLDKKIFAVNALSVVQVPITGIPSSLHGVWFIPSRIYYVLGDGFYRKYSISSQDAWTDLSSSITNYYLEGIRGNAINDIVACGAFGEVVHFNGISWKSYLPQTALENGEWYSVAIRGDLVFAVGYEGARGVVLRGRRL